jgi:hypothetical protein
MALKVHVTTPNALKVEVTAPQKINTTIKKVSLPLVNLEELKNVDTAQLENGYTLVWNESTQQWVSQSLNVDLHLAKIDGGVY